MVFSGLRGLKIHVRNAHKKRLEQEGFDIGEGPSDDWFLSGDGVRHRLSPAEMDQVKNSTNSSKLYTVIKNSSLSDDKARQNANFPPAS